MLILASAWGNPQPAQIASGAILGAIISMMFLAGSHFSQLPPRAIPILPASGAGEVGGDAPQPIVIEAGINESLEAAFARYERVADDQILFDSAGRMFSGNQPKQELVLRLPQQAVSALFDSQP